MRDVRHSLVETRQYLEALRSKRERMRQLATLGDPEAEREVARARRRERFTMADRVRELLRGKRIGKLAVKEVLTRREGQFLTWMKVTFEPYVGTVNVMHRRREQAAGKALILEIVLSSPIHTMVVQAQLRRIGWKRIGSQDRGGVLRRKTVDAQDSFEAAEIAAESIQDLMRALSKAIR